MAATLLTMSAGLVPGPDEFYPLLKPSLSDAFPDDSSLFVFDAKNNDGDRTIPGDYSQVNYIESVCYPLKCVSVWILMDVFVCVCFIFGTWLNHSHTTLLLSIEVMPLSFAIDGILGVGFPRSHCPCCARVLVRRGAVGSPRSQTEQLLAVGLLATIPSTTDSPSPTHVTRLVGHTQTSQQRWVLIWKLVKEIQAQATAGRSKSRNSHA